MLPERLLSKHQVATMLGLHPASVMRLVNQGRFPRPLHTSGTTRGAVRWCPKDIEAWLSSRAA
jgi:predicted DNA-binding transcriptional regulator AlpA